MTSGKETDRQLRDLAACYQAGRINRRELLRSAGLLVGGGALMSFMAACSPATQAPAAAPAEGTAAPETDTASAEGQPVTGGSLKIAFWFEPGILDPVFTTRYQTLDVACNFFEGLFADDSTYSPKLMLAESYETSDDGLTATIGLRKGVPFHNGKEMTSEDVLASMRRWREIGANGMQVSKRIDEITAPDPYTIQVKFLKPTGLFPTYLSLADACIMPAEVADAAGKDVMTEVIGTGPFKFIEHIPDRHIRAERFADYAARTEEPNGMSGRKTAYVDDATWFITTEASVRMDGLLTGEYDFAGILNWDSYDDLNANPDLTTLLTKPYEWLAIHLNKKQGLMTNLKMRQAIQRLVDLDPPNMAAFGSPDFYRLDPGIAGRETAYYSDVGDELFNKPDPEAAKALLAEAGYDGEPVVFMTNKESQANYDLALTFKSQFEATGINVDLQVMDSSTLRSRREDPELWNCFITGHPAAQHPVMHVFLNSTWPGWWESEKKDELVDAILSEPDFDKVYSLVEDLQRLVYDDVALVKTGEYFVLHACRSNFKGYAKMLRPFMFNTWLEK